MKIKFIKFMVVAILAGLFISSCLKSDVDDKKYTRAEELHLLEKYLNTLAQEHNIDTTENGLYYVILEEGVGELAKNGDTLSISYEGYLIDYTIFDASKYHSTNSLNTIDFILGKDPLITGFETGLKLLNKNTRALLIIPSELGYGDQRYNNIPPNQTLIFALKLHEIKPS